MKKYRTYCKYCFRRYWSKIDNICPKCKKRINKLIKKKIIKRNPHYNYNKEYELTLKGRKNKWKRKL